MAKTTWNPRNLEEHWGTPKLKTTDSWKANKKGEKRKLRRKEKLPPWPCAFVRSVSLLLQGPWMCVKRRCWESREMRSSPGVDTHTLFSSVGRWWRREVNIISAESATGGSHERSLIFSCWRDTWFILFSRKADHAPMKISGGFHHHYCSPHTIFKCILDYVAM